MSPSSFCPEPPTQQRLSCWMGLHCPSPLLLNNDQDGTSWCCGPAQCSGWFRSFHFFLAFLPPNKVLIISLLSVCFFSALPAKLSREGWGGWTPFWCLQRGVGGGSVALCAWGRAAAGRGSLALCSSMWPSSRHGAQKDEINRKGCTSTSLRHAQPWGLPAVTTLPYLLLLL